MQQMAFWSLIQLSFLIVSPVRSFNLDDRYFSEIRENPNQYFGYSIGFRKHLNQYKILVGSPRTNSSTSEDSPGALYECDMEPPNDCRMVRMVLPTELDIMRKNQWLGVALDTSPRDSRITVCAHRVLRKSDYYADILRGACYELRNTDAIQLPKNYTINDGFMSAYGISCRYSKNGSLLIGVPAFKKGGYDIIKYNEHPTFYKNGYEDYYEGYAVSFIDNDPVIGKPRYEEYGAVRVYQELVLSPQTKYTFGSYFGSAIAVADFNMDGYKDLVIGAPFYTETFTEEGRVYIYLNTKSSSSSAFRFNDYADVVLNEPNYRAQFGKSVVTGDFNSDTFPDVIVGAPYENDGAGCIYVYNGKYGGLDPIYSQRIKAESIRDGLRSFGISFTRAIDLDQNAYEDIGVGAYLSDSVYVFKSRSTYNVKSTLFALPRVLDLVPTCYFNDRLVLCVNLSVNLAITTESYMSYNLHFITDYSKVPDERRTYFSNRQNELTESVTVKKTFQKEYVIYIKSTVDIMSPIDFKLHYSLEDKGYSANCKPLCPISKNGTITDTVKFNLNCGSDEICETRLKVKVNYAQQNIILGKDKKLKVLIEVSNLGEHAYNTISRIFFSPFLDFESLSKAPNSTVECTSVNKMELSCFIGNPLKEKNKKRFALNFVIDTASKATEVFVAVNASTESLVKPKYFKNTVNSTLKFNREFKLELAALSVPESIGFTGKETAMTVKHVYHLRNNGPSNAYLVTFSLVVPHIVINKAPLLTIAGYRMLDEEKKAIELIADEIDCGLETMVGTAAEHQIDIKALYKHGNIATCSWLKCHRFVCKLSKLPIANPKVFELTMNINTRVLQMFQNIKIRVFDVVSKGELSHAMSDLIIKSHRDSANATTSFMINRLRKQIQWWIVVLSIIIGLIFLIIVGIVLWKLGFFQRQRITTEERKSLRRPNEDDPNSPDEEPEGEPEGEPN